MEFLVDYEDIYLNIEKMFIDEIGFFGGKLYIGRSWNDQVVIDMYLYLKNYVGYIIELIEVF